MLSNKTSHESEFVMEAFPNLAKFECKADCQSCEN